MKRLLFALSVLALPVSAVTINSFSVQDTQHDSIRFVGTLTPDAYVQVNCGTAMGGPYTKASSVSYLTGVQFDSGVFALSIGNLKSNTQFFCTATARPNANNATGLVTSSEVNVTTLTASPPVAPTAPTAVNLSFPTFAANYTIIPIGLSGGICKAKSTVGPITYGTSTWTVTSGQDIQTILNEVGFGAILEIDQGIICPVPDTNSHAGGFCYPIVNIGGQTTDPLASGINDPAHRWVVIRTHAVSAADFPPSGTRISAGFAPKLANFQAQLITDAVFTSGSIFESCPGISGGHHFLAYDIEESVNASVGAGPWGAFNQFGSPFQTAPPQYMWLDRIYVPDQTASGVLTANFVWGSPGANTAITDNYVAKLDDPMAGNTPSFIYFADCGTGPHLIDNNFSQTLFQGIYYETVSGWGCTGSTLQATSYDDVTISHNYLYMSLTALDNALTGVWDGIQRSFRNVIEAKRGRRWAIVGNTIDGCFAYQNDGSCIFASGSSNANTTGESGELDWTIQNNLFKHAAGGLFRCSGISPVDAFNGANPVQNQRFNASNNWAHDLGFRLYRADDAAGTGLNTGYWTVDAGCGDVVIQNNTAGFLNADNGMSFFLPSILKVGDGMPLSAGFSHTLNIEYFAGSTLSALSGIWSEHHTDCCSAPYVYSQSIASTNQSTIFNTAFIETSATTSATGIWGGNVIIGSNNANVSEPWPDLTQARLNTLSANMPGVITGGSVTSDTYPAGATQAAREASVGFTPATGICTGCGGAGANISTIYTTMDLVTGISVTPASTSIAFTYTAPDTRACNVDTSTDNFATWTRTADGGGASPRTPAASGLTSGTLYYYRILCYFSQTSTLFSGSQVTDGTVTTTSGGASGSVISGKSVHSGNKVIH